MANPDILIFKIDETCEKALRKLRDLEREKTMDTGIVHCGCGLNPLLQFFATGELAMVETLLRAIQRTPQVSLFQRREALGDILDVWAQIRSEEVSAFCSMCMKKHRIARKDLLPQDESLLR